MGKYILLIKNTGLLALSSISTKLISFLLLPLYTYYLSTEEYAAIDLITLLQTLLVPVLTLSLFEAVLRFGIERCKDRKKIFTVGFIASVVSCLIVCFCAGPVMQALELSQYKFFWIAVYSVTVFMSFFGVFSRTIGKIKLMAVVSAFSSISVIILNVFAVAVFKLGVSGYLSAMIIGNGIGCCLYMIKGKFYTYFDFKVDRNLLKQMLIYAIPMIPNSILWWINNSVNKFFLSSMATLSVVGIFSVASKIPMLMDTLNRIFQQAWSLSAFQEFDSDKSKQFYSNIFNIFSIIMMFISAGVVLCSELIGRLMFSKDFFIAWKLVPWLIAGAFFTTLSSFLASIFMAYKKTKVLFLTNGVGAVINVLLSLLLIPKYGADGAAVSALISNYVIWLMSYYLVSKFIRLEFNFFKATLMHIMLIAECIVISQDIKFSVVYAMIICMVLLGMNIFKFKEIGKLVLKKKGKNK